MNPLCPCWHNGGSISGRSIVIRRHEEHPNQTVTASLFEAMCATTEKLQGLRPGDPQRASEIALRRFGLGCGRDDSADALVDFVVALEALLLPYGDDERSEMSFRFRLHGSYSIATNPLERSTVFRQLQDL